VLFLSGHPQANVRGATAHHLIIFDESQDFSATTAETVFAPMCASTNATRLYMGTPKTSNTYLAQKRRELEAMQKADGRQRVFIIDWRTVARELPAYKRFVEAEIRKKGIRHPSIVTEFLCDEIDAVGGLFDGRRQALMRGSHGRRDEPDPAKVYAAVLDVAGEDEGEPGNLENPGRDYTICWIFDVDMTQAEARGGNTYRAVACFADHGSAHFDDSGATAPLAQRLLAFLELWQVAHLIADESGVGLGLTNWLIKQMGKHRVTGYTFTAANKARLGVEFIAVIETGRFAMCADDDEHTAAFWRQVEACQYTADPHKPLESGLRWAVPDSATYETTDEHGKIVKRKIHDDYLIAAALVSQLDGVPLGRAESAVIPATDPLESTEW
jgi:hypothetical protein